MYKCKYCNLEFNSKRGLIIHIQSIHNKLKDYNSKYKFYNYELENLENPKCKICGKEINIKYRGISLNYCDNPQCKFLYKSNNMKLYYDEHPEVKEKLREKRLKYLSDKSNFNSTAFGKRINKELSFLEKWFYDNIIKKYNLTDKYTIINEYTFNKYSLDFAFINIKLDVELDGTCHFNNGKRIEHDIERDKYLIDNGWHIYRISWYDFRYNENKTIYKFIDFLTKNNFIYDKSYYLRNKVISNQEFKYQEEQRNNKKQKKELEKQNKYNYNRNIIIDLEKNSNIDFSKYGWVTLANKYLINKGYNIKQLHRYIKRYYPEFFENNKVFIRMLHTV